MLPTKTPEQWTRSAGPEMSTEELRRATPAQKARHQADGDDLAIGYRLTQKIVEYLEGRPGFQSTYRDILQHTGHRFGEQIVRVFVQTLVRRGYVVANADGTVITLVQSPYTEVIDEEMTPMSISLPLAAQTSKAELAREFLGKDDAFWGLVPEFPDDLDAGTVVFKTSRRGWSWMEPRGYATMIRRMIGRRAVYISFSRENNPASYMGAGPGYGWGFTLIDNRFVVDPLVSQLVDASEVPPHVSLTGVYDMLDPFDSHSAKFLYGKPSKWESVTAGFAEKVNEEMDGPAPVDGILSRAFKLVPVQVMTNMELKETYGKWASSYDGLVLAWFHDWVESQTMRQVSPKKSLRKRFMNAVAGVGADTITKSLHDYLKAARFQVPRDFSKNTANDILGDFGIPTNRNAAVKGRLITGEDAFKLRERLRTLRGQRAVEKQGLATAAAVTGKSAEEVKLIEGVKAVEDQAERMAYDLEASIKESAALRKAYDELKRTTDAERVQMQRELEKCHRKGRELAAQARAPPPPAPVMPAAPAPPPAPPPPADAPTIESTRAALGEVRRTATKAMPGDLLGAIQRGRSLKTPGPLAPKIKSSPLAESSAFRKAMAARRRGVAGDTLASAAEMMSVIDALASGDMVFDSHGKIQIAAEMDALPTGCTMCGHPATVSSCVCGAGQFCSNACLSANWTAGHGRTCKGK